MKNPPDYRLRAVRVFTADLRRAVDFYTNRLGMKPDAIDEAEGFALFPAGQATLLLESINPDDEEAADLVGRFVGASFEVDDIHGVYDSLSSRGVRFSQTPQKQSWGGTLTHFFDSDDNLLTLVQYGDSRTS